MRNSTVFLDLGLLQEIEKAEKREEEAIQKKREV